MILPQLAQRVNSLWHSGAIWRQRSGLTNSTLTQVMACCLMAVPEPILTSSFVRFCSIHLKSNYMVSVWAIILYNKFENHTFKLLPYLPGANELTHWGRMTHIYVSKLTIIGPDNGLSPDWRQVIIWTNAGILLIGPLGTNCSGNSYIFIQENAFENVVQKMVAILSRPQWVNRREGNPTPSLGKASMVQQPTLINTLSLQQNGWHFADNIFKYVFLNENLCIRDLNFTELKKFVSRGPIHKNLVLLQAMAWSKHTRHCLKPWAIDGPLH